MSGRLTVRALYRKTVAPGSRMDPLLARRCSPSRTGITWVFLSQAARLGVEPEFCIDLSQIAPTYSSFGGHNPLIHMPPMRPMWPDSDRILVTFRGTPRTPFINTPMYGKAWSHIFGELAVGDVHYVKPLPIFQGEAMLALEAEYALLKTPAV